MEDWRGYCGSRQRASKRIAAARAGGARALGKGPRQKWHGTGQEGEWGNDGVIGQQADNSKGEDRGKNVEM